MWRYFKAHGSPLRVAFSPWQDRRERLSPPRSA